MTTQRNSNSNVAARREVFLEKIAEDGNFSRACRLAGLDRAGVYSVIRKDPEFNDRYQDALEQATDVLEAEARRRALEGTEEPVFFQGAECGKVRKYSDSLMALMLKANRPKYRDSARMEIGNVPGESFKTESESPSQLARRLGFILASGLRHAATATEQNLPEEDTGEDLA